VSTTNSDEIMEVGCDYITATTRDDSSNALLGSFGHYLLRDAVSRGAKRHCSRTLGYTTAYAEGVSIGRRDDGWCLRASGATAREHWFQIQDLADNITRFDVQCTVRGRLEPCAVLLKVWQANPGQTSGDGRRSEVKMVVGRHGAQTIYVASRQSERFLRIYDKYVESRDEWYRGAVRWELELKGDAAMRYCSTVAAIDDQEHDMAAMLFTFCKSRLRICPSAGRLRWSAVDRTLRDHSREPAADCMRTLRYLTKSVKPCIDRLKAAGYEKEIRQILDL
jgi:Putative phage replication protein RstA